MVLPPIQTLKENGNRSKVRNKRNYMSRFVGKCSGGLGIRCRVIRKAATVVVVAIGKC
jgi:hypothetical protein